MCGSSLMMNASDGEIFRERANMASLCPSGELYTNTLWRPDKGVSKVRYRH